MLCLVQDVHTNVTVSVPIHLTQWAHPTRVDIFLSSLDVDTISQYVTLVTAATAPIFPPVAIFGTTFIFVRWLSTAVLENVYASLPILTFFSLLVMSRPSVQRLLVAYIVDLICVLKELLNVVLRPELAHTITWTELQEALVAYEQTDCRQRVHSSICSKISLTGPILTTEGISRIVQEMLQESPQIDLSILN